MFVCHTQFIFCYFWLTFFCVRKKIISIGAEIFFTMSLENECNSYDLQQTIEDWCVQLKHNWSGIINFSSVPYAFMPHPCILFF